MRFSGVDGLDPEALTEVLIAGLAAGEFRRGRGVVYQLLGASEFILEPLPDLVFFRDPSAWIPAGGCPPSWPASSTRTTRCSPGPNRCTGPGSNRWTAVTCSWRRPG